jgi:hypothetical protein
MPTDRFLRYEETAEFRAWLEKKGYNWARMSLAEREDALAEEQREGLEEAAVMPRDDRFVRFEGAAGFQDWLARKGYDWAHMTLAELMAALAEERRERLEGE